MTPDDDARQREDPSAEPEEKPAIGWVSGALETRSQGDRILIERRRRATLVMFSGGIDSTYTLAKLLRETDDEILVHHIHLVNPEGRHLVEAKACARIVDYCRTHFRDFSFSESAIDHRGFRFFGYDMISVGFEAGIVAQSYLAARERMPDRWTVGSCTEEGSNPDRWPHVLACFAANCFPFDPPRYFNLPIVPKAEEMAYLPPALLDLVWTCRTPRRSEEGFTECGDCKTCKLMAEVRRRPEVPAGTDG